MTKTCFLKLAPLVLAAFLFAQLASSAVIEPNRKYLIKISGTSGDLYLKKVTGGKKDSYGIFVRKGDNPSQFNITKLSGDKYSIESNGTYIGRCNQCGNPCGDSDSLLFHTPSSKACTGSCQWTIPTADDPSAMSECEENGGEKPLEPVLISADTKANLVVKTCKGREVATLAKKGESGTKVTFVPAG